MIYLLDTNIVSYLIRGDVSAQTQLAKVPTYQVAVSVITEAEMLFGVVKRGGPKQLKNRVDAFLQRARVLAWTREVAIEYAHLRTSCESIGAVLAPLDMMIAAHASHIGAILVTRDKAFIRTPTLKVERWL